MGKASRTTVFTLVVLAVLFCLSVCMNAQSEGNNAISSNSSGTIVASTAYIDGSAFFNDPNTGNGDICKTIHYILTTGYPTAGAVVDLRGILPTPPNTVLTCLANLNPFSGITTAAPTTLLLPASNIEVKNTWTLPSNTRLIGEGSGSINYTEFQIVASNFAGNAMIQMGTASGDTGVTIEHMRLEALGVSTATPTDGIDNLYAGDGSYVNDVVFHNVGANTTSGISNACSPGGGGTVNGLCISPPTSTSTGAAYSGPYTNMNFTGPIDCTSPNGNSVMCLPTACVKIQAQIRGLHGITCTGKADQSQAPPAAIYLDAYNDSVENVHVEGFYDAIVVGDDADGEINSNNNVNITGNVIANVTGAYGGNSGPVWEAVHICNPAATSQNSLTACTTVTSNPPTVNNLTILQAQSKGNGSAPSFSATTIRDDVAGATLNTATSAAFVGLYALGGQVGSITNPPAYSRFTTSNSANTPTWAVGSHDALTTVSCTNGAVYSNTGGVSGMKDTIYVCTGGAWAPIGQ